MTYEKAERIGARYGYKTETQMLNAIEFVEDLLREETDKLRELLADGKAVSGAEISRSERATSVVSNLTINEEETEEGGI